MGELPHCKQSPPGPLCSHTRGCDAHRHDWVGLLSGDKGPSCYPGLPDSPAGDSTGRSHSYPGSDSGGLMPGHHDEETYLREDR